MNKLCSQLKFILLVLIIYTETNHDRSDNQEATRKKDNLFQDNYFC